MKYSLCSILFLFLATQIPQNCFAQTQVDSSAIKKVVLKYVESFYGMNPELGQQSIHPLLAKRTIKTFPDGSQFLEMMTFEQMANLGKVFNRSGRYGKDSKKNITILDMLSETASVKLEAEGWVDYIHLGKFEGDWKIINILWQWTKE